MQEHWQICCEDGPCGAVEMFSLQVPDGELNLLAGLLSEDERVRAARFMSRDHGACFTVAHGRLRQVLSKLLGQPAESLEFSLGDHGKPELAGQAAASGLRFNLSHSGGVGFLGWARGRGIGVDVELWRPLRDQAALVRRYFSGAEIAGWEALPGEFRERAFFEIWTRKEAYIKALGVGLSLPLDSFDVSLARAGTNLLVRPSARVPDEGLWSLTALEAGSGISAAVALEAGFCHIESRVGHLEY